MTRFILNNSLVETDLRSGSTVVDYIRSHERLTGTKIGCREGDCGACTILVGDIEKDRLVYRSMASCLMTLGNANGKHLVTVEGINMKKLSPVQAAMADAHATQCGFCTSGFVMSLSGFMLNEQSRQYNEAIASIDGNICRCTGYKSIERAASSLTRELAARPLRDTIGWLAENDFIPVYFTGIKTRLEALRKIIDPEPAPHPQGRMMMGGGTDLVVQKPLKVKKADLRHVYDDPAMKTISFENDQCQVGASVTVTGFLESARIQDVFPELGRHMKLIASTPIRNMATMAGNLVNASPIGDMSIFFLALNSDLQLKKGAATRVVSLKNFYQAYKQIDLEDGEIIEKIMFTPPGKGNFSFEKVSKRTHLDIASVNSACQAGFSEDGIISMIHLSAGGVAPVPLYLSDTVAFLTGKKIGVEVLKQAIAIMDEEISPIGDARGSAAYKRLLLRQLFLSHLMTLDNRSAAAVKEIMHKI